ncbi:MAG: hypothetical protein M5U22_05870 [Thermoleophilia bacterium]|nr:hypothetical protein [Thermoleophilia bacterium]
MRDRGRTTRPHTECLRGVAGGGFLLVLLSLVLLLTGCKIEMGLDTKVEKDGSGTLGVRIAADKEILDLIQQQGAARTSSAISRVRCRPIGRSIVAPTPMVRSG